jgi:hypothetical protein
MACPVRFQERLRGWRCRGPLFGDRPCEDSRVPMTRGRTRHSGWRGGVLSPHASTASGNHPNFSPMLGGYPKNSDGSPNTREREFLTRSNIVLGRKEAMNLPVDGTSSNNLNPFTRALAPPFIGRRRDFYISKTPSSSKNIPNVNTYKNVFSSNIFTSLPPVHTHY